MLIRGRGDRSDRDHWWLRNTWTAAVQDYHEGGGCLPTDWFRPCGRLPAEYGKTANVRANRPARGPPGGGVRLGHNARANLPDTAR